MSSLLQSRAYKAAGGRTTTCKLEPAFWEALDKIVEREQSSVSVVLRRAEETRTHGSAASAIRIYIMKHYRDAATEEGHRLACHGILSAEIPDASHTTHVTRNKPSRTASLLLHFTSRHRSTIGIEPEFLEALNEIAARENTSPSRIASTIAAYDIKVASPLRTYILRYFSDAVTCQS
jgi:predicted DNA-binding ribbon-helix-helix protein